MKEGLTGLEVDGIVFTGADGGAYERSDDLSCDTDFGERGSCV